MQSLDPGFHRFNYFLRRGLGGLAAIFAAAWLISPACHAKGTDGGTNGSYNTLYTALTNAMVNGPSNTLTNAPVDAPVDVPSNAPSAVVQAPTDPVLNLLLEKGVITEEEAAKTQAQADALRTNMAAQYAQENSKWKIGKDIKDLELFGDLRLRYEDREESDPTVSYPPDGKKHPGVPAGKIDLYRFRYALRFGMRGDLFDDFYFGFRLETSSNPRSTFVTMGTGSPGPDGKSALGIDVGQLYIGWDPTSWFDFTVGRMPNPLYTSTMVWSPSINPEGLAEHLKASVGDLDVYANLAQFLYQDENPIYASSGLLSSGSLLQSADNIFQVAWQAGFNYRITTNISFKAAATYYQYFGLKRSSTLNPGEVPYYGDPYIGEGAYTGPGSLNVINGFSGYGTSWTVPGYLSSGYPNNQVGLDHLSVLEIPFEFNVRIKGLNFKAFADFAYNLDGRARAEEAQQGYAAYLKFEGATIKPFKAQVNDVQAYQFGLAVGNKDSLGLVYGTTSKKNAWEIRAYWQHIEQYSLDPNLLDLDYNAGAENLQGFFTAFAYGFSDNTIGTVRFGEAERINNLLGTGGTGTDIPEINPIKSFELIQADLTFKF